MNGRVNQALLRAYQRASEGITTEPIAPEMALMPNPEDVSALATGAAIALATKETDSETMVPIAPMAVGGPNVHTSGNLEPVTPETLRSGVCEPPTHKPQRDETVLYHDNSESYHNDVHGRRLFSEWPIRPRNVLRLNWNAELRRIAAVATEVGSLNGLTEAIARMMAQRPICVAMTSLQPHQGVTTVAAITASALARRGIRTVLIDTDWESPGVADCAGVAMENRTTENESTGNRTIGWDRIAERLFSPSTDHHDLGPNDDGHAQDDIYDAKSIRALEETLLRDAESGVELLTLARRAHHPAMMVGVLRELIGRLHADRRCVLLDTGILLEPPFDTVPADAIPIGCRHRYLLAEQPRLAHLRSVIDWLLLVRNPEQFSDAVTTDAVRELRRCGIENIAIVDNFAE